jgi:nucleoside-diphosphate-sugar epimerase
MEQVAGRAFLLTGGAGFAGGNLARRLVAEGARAVHIVDNLLSSERENVPEGRVVRFTRGSIADDAVLASIDDEYDYVFHLATFHGNQSSIHDPLADHANNTLTTLKLYERVKSFQRLRRLVYSSAGCSVAEKTFGAPLATEEADVVSVHQDSPYSMSKVFGEFYSSYYFRRHGTPVVRARFQNVYGPGEVLGAGQWRGTPATVWRNVVPTFVYKALKGQPLPLENSGRTSRDFVFVEDIVAGLLRCAFAGRPGEAYNLASGEETTIRQLAETINLVTGNRAGVELLPERAWDRSGRRFGSTEKAARELGYRTSVRLDEGLRRTVEWTKANLALIERCIARHAHHMPG